MAGRPAMTPEQKAAAKAAREAAKNDATAGAKGKADAAEARAGGGKKPSAAAAPPTGGNTDDLDREEKALFLHHLPLVKAGRERVGKATAGLRNLYKKAKAEGNFTKADFDTALALETAEQEARERAKIARALKIAKIVGSSMGNQLDLFLEPDRTPIADRAYAEGEKASMENKKAAPPYDPSTEAYRQFMSGFHAHQATLAKGIKPTNEAVKEDVKVTADQKATNDQQRAQDDKAFQQADKPNGEGDKPPAETVKDAEPPPAAPTSGTPMTRAQFKAQKDAEAAAGGKPN